MHLNDLVIVLPISATVPVELVFMRYGGERRTWKASQWVKEEAIDDSTKL